MKLNNIRELNYFRRADLSSTDGKIATFEQFLGEYGFEADGVNTYISLSQAAQAELNQEMTPDRAYARKHRDFFAAVKKSIQDGPIKKRCVVIGLEPFEPNDPYGYVKEVEESRDWVTVMAQELHALQQSVQPDGTLNLVVRYASEMNQRNNKYSWSLRPSAEFRESYRFVRDIFRIHAPDIRFSFSPVINVGTNLQTTYDFWPEKPSDPEPYVDVVGCTWYVGKQSDVTKSTNLMLEYFNHFKSLRLPLGFDELGGVDMTKDSAGIETHFDNDRVIVQMLGAVEAARQTHGLSFDYATIFMQSKFSVDVTLRFLQGSDWITPTAPIHADSASTASDTEFSISGKVLLPGGQGAPNIPVGRRPQAAPTTSFVTVKTDAQGNYVLPGVSPGTWVVTVTDRISNPHKLVLSVIDADLEDQNFEVSTSLIHPELSQSASDALQRVGFTAARITKIIDESSGSPSYGTHKTSGTELNRKYGNAMDLKVAAHSADVDKEIHALRMEGFAAWHRTDVGSGPHYHVVWAGSKSVNPRNDRQICSFVRGRAGLTHDVKETNNPITAAEIAAVKAAYEAVSGPLNPKTCQPYGTP